MKRNLPPGWGRESPRALHEARLLRLFHRFAANESQNRAVEALGTGLVAFCSAIRCLSKKGRRSAMTLKEFFTQFFTWWNGQTLNTRFHTWRHGELVGEDEFGNHYYRTRGRRQGSRARL